MRKEIGLAISYPSIVVKMMICPKQSSRGMEGGFPHMQWKRCYILVTTKMEMVKNMSLRNDAIFLEIIDDLASNNLEQLENLLSHLFNGVWQQEIGTPQSILVAAIDWIRHYNDGRNSDLEPQAAMDSATAKTLSNPNVQQLMADLMAKNMSGAFK